jgi:hypothetical protein
VILAIQGAGGLAVIAHPACSAFASIEQFTVLPDGIETWNSKYDGRSAPRPQTFAFLQRLQQRRPEMRAFYGQDLHWKTQNRRLCTVVECGRLTPSDVLSSLRQGRYVGVMNGIVLPSDGLLSSAQMASFASHYERSRRFREFAIKAHRMLRKHDLRMPAGIKAQFRRLF